MILRFHAEKTTRQTLVHANWLPGMPTYCYPFAEYVNERLPGLDTWVEYTEAPIAQEDYAGLLGLSEDRIDLGLGIGLNMRDDFFSAFHM